mmetsp:Transcript_63380/g.113061  ORF Transcript_63380/g.113061 Transcript_63380/m.113061 type:complete len:262 (+) Transcript_63380:1384-2169(+)
MGMRRRMMTPIRPPRSRVKCGRNSSPLRFCTICGRRTSRHAACWSRSPGIPGPLGPGAVVRCAVFRSGATPSSHCQRSCHGPIPSIGSAHHGGSGSTACGPRARLLPPSWCGPQPVVPWPNSLNPTVKAPSLPVRARALGRPRSASVTCSSAMAHWTSDSPSRARASTTSHSATCCTRKGSRSLPIRGGCTSRWRMNGPGLAPRTGNMCTGRLRRIGSPSATRGIKGWSSLTSPHCPRPERRGWISRRWWLYGYTPDPPSS